MKLYISGVIATSVLIILLSSSKRVDCLERNNPNSVYNETMYIYLLMARDQDLKRLRRFRQDDDDGGNSYSFGQASQFVGQIIQGVLGGDVAPIFAGSVKFVENPSAQQNIGSFLGTIAPGLNLVLREMYTRAQVALGFATTPKPTSPTPLPFLEYETEDVQNKTQTRNPIGSTTTSHQQLLEQKLAQQQLLEQQLAQQQQLIEQQQQQLMKQQLAIEAAQAPQVVVPPQALAPPAPPPTSAWEYVVNNQLRYQTTTVEPLPLLRPRTTTPDDDDNEEGDNLKIVN